MAVLYWQDIEQWGNANSEVFIKKWTQARLDALQAELISAKDADRKKQIKDEILAIKREFNRSKQFGIVMEKKPAEWKNNLDSVSAADLMRLDKEVSKEKRGEFLAKSFLYKRTTDSEGNIIEEPVETGKITQGDTLFVDFGKNRSAERRIGTGHMLPWNINIVKIISNVNGKALEQFWVRWTYNNLTGYYSPEWRYLPVYTGDMIVVPKQEEVTRIEWLKDTKVVESSVEILQKRNLAEDAALEKFVWEIEGLEKIEKWFWLSTLLIREAWKNTKYQDTLNRAIEIGEWYIKNWHEKYSKDDLQIAVNRLKKTKELLWEKNLWLNIESYKAAIAMFESGAKSYMARNDEKARGLWVNPDKYAYGKYQFIPSTLRGYSSILSNYGITISKPATENEIQSWLTNSDAQEAVMDQYIIDMATWKILTNSRFSQEISEDPTKIAYYLALTHIGWEGALYNQNRVDYFDTSVSKYSNITWERYKNMLA